jgi:gluconolactonase
MVTILRDAGLTRLIASDVLERKAGGFQFTEGPLWLPDGSLLFQDIRAERTYRLDPDGSVHVVREQTRAANGQTFGLDGSIVFCEQTGRRLSRLSLSDGAVESLVETWAGARLNSPNDVVCRSDGLIYFTDPAYGVEPGQRALHFQGVFVFDPQAGGAEALRLLVDDLEKPYGVALAPDEQTLYVCDTGRYHVRAFDLAADGAIRVGTGRVFARVDPGQPGGPDGMKVDRSGRVYVAVALGVWVFEPDGRLIGIIALPARPSNMAWCGSDASGLAITAVDAVYHIRLRAQGLMPPLMPPAVPGRVSFPAER